MAFKKSYETQAGVTGDHWEIMNVTVDKTLEFMMVKVNLFLSQSACSAKKTPIFADTVTLTNAEYWAYLAAVNDPANPVHPTVEAYNVLAAKTDKPWYGGTPVNDTYGMPL